MSEIKANGYLCGYELSDIPVLNPGDWFGKTSLFLIVEAYSMSDAIDELADNERYGHLITVEDEHLRHYPGDDRHYSGSGNVLDLDQLMIYGQEGAEISFPCRYYGEGLPDEGVLPIEFDTLMRITTRLKDINRATHGQTTIQSRKGRRHARRIVVARETLDDADSACSAACRRGSRRPL